MPGSSNTSFIPKRSPNSRPERSSSPKQIFIGTFLVQVLFFAVLIAAAAVFFYQRHLNGQLNTAVANFKAATDTYQSDGEKLQAITTMDGRLIQASNLLKNSVSVSTLLSSLEQAIAEPIQVTKLDYSLTDKGKLSLEAEIVTDSFDSTIFQRSLFTGGELFQDTTLDDVTISTTISNPKDKKTEDINTKAGEIKFKAIINIDPKAVKSIPVFIPVKESTFETASSTTTGSSTEATDQSDVSVGFGNQDNI